MPRFYFHVCNGNGFTEDEEGQELADVETARAKAVVYARDIMAAEVQRGMLDLSSFIEIEDEDKKLVDSLSFEQAVDLSRHHKADEC